MEAVQAATEKLEQAAAQLREASQAVGAQLSSLPQELGNAVAAVQEQLAVVQQAVGATEQVRARVDALKAAADAPEQGGQGAAGAADAAGAASGSLEEENVGKMKVAELQAELEARGLEKKGRKAQLAARLLEAVAAETEKAAAPEVAETSASAAAAGPEGGEDKEAAEEPGKQAEEVKEEAPADGGAAAAAEPKPAEGKDEGELVTSAAQPRAEIQVSKTEIAGEEASKAYARFKETQEAAVSLYGKPAAAAAAAAEASITNLSLAPLEKRRELFAQRVETGAQNIGVTEEPDKIGMVKSFSARDRWGFILSEEALAMDAAAAAGTAGDAASETAQERPQDLFFHHRDILDTPQHVESGQRVYYRFQMGTEGAREGKPQAKLVRAVTEVTALKPEDEVAPPVAPEVHALAMLGFAKSHRAEWQSWLESKDNEALQAIGMDPAAHDTKTHQLFHDTMGAAVKAGVRMKGRESRRAQKRQIQGEYTGVVKTYRPHTTGSGTTQYWGFIQPTIQPGEVRELNEEGGEDMFVHECEVIVPDGEDKILRAGMQVTYTTKRDKKHGTQAASVRPLYGAPSVALRPGTGRGQGPLVKRQKTEGPAGREMMGTVKSFSRKDGWGFVIPDGGGRDAFLRGADILPDSAFPMGSTVVSGQRVQFVHVEDSSRRPQAKAVKRLLAPDSPEGGPARPLMDARAPARQDRGPGFTVTYEGRAPNGPI